MVFCPKCGTKNIDGACFCVKCGAAIVLPPQDDAAVSRVQAPRRRYLLIFLVLLIGLAVGILTAHLRTERQDSLPETSAPVQSETAPSKPVSTAPSTAPTVSTVPEASTEATDARFLCQACNVWSVYVEEGLCEDCATYGGRCSKCGKLFSKLDYGLCADCKPMEKKIDCAYCGETFKASQINKDGLCEECFWYVGLCKGCGKLSANLFEGFCEECEPWGGRGEPEECCVHCGTPSYELTTGLCTDCYWYVGWCSQCGKLAYEIYDGICTDCIAANEPKSQCSVCGNWSSDVFEGICDACGGYDGRG